MTWMSQRGRTYPWQKYIGESHLNKISPKVAGASWLFPALGILQKLEKMTFCSLAWFDLEMKERLGTERLGLYPRVLHQGFTYATFSFGGSKSGCTCHGSLPTLETNVFPTTFNLQSCNRDTELLCPLFWPWPTQDDVEIGVNWEEKNGSDSCLWNKWTNVLPDTTEKCNQTFSKDLNFHFK